MKNPAAVALGKLGGSAGTGAAKARTSEQARAAVAARWSKTKRKPNVRPGCLTYELSDRRANAPELACDAQRRFAEAIC
jgi:hypothetical protein